MLVDRSRLLQLPAQPTDWRCKLGFWLPNQVSFAHSIISALAEAHGVKEWLLIGELVRAPPRFVSLSPRVCNLNPERASWVVVVLRPSSAPIESGRMPMPASQPAKSLRKVNFFSTAGAAATSIWPPNGIIHRKFYAAGLFGTAALFSVTSHGLLEQKSATVPRLSIAGNDLIVLAGPGTRGTGNSGKF